ncbi:MAG: hypothetical protein P8012_07280 [Desulfobacterales bacterium]
MSDVDKELVIGINPGRLPVLGLDQICGAILKEIGVPFPEGIESPEEAE